MHDLRFALRQLLTNSGFTAVAAPLVTLERPEIGTTSGSRSSPDLTLSAAGGTVSLLDEAITYAPPGGGFSGPDTFTYTVSDGHGAHACVRFR